MAQNSLSSWVKKRSASFISASALRSLLSEALKIKLDQIFDISVRFDEIYRFSFTTSKKPELYFLDKKDTNTNKVISNLTTKKFNEGKFT